MVIDLVSRFFGLVWFALFMFGIAFGWHWTRCWVEDVYGQYKAKAKKRK